MSKTTEFKLVISGDGKDVFSTTLSYDLLSSIVSAYPDDAKSQDFFTMAAKHPASIVREQVAGKDNLSEKTVNMLVSDKSISVLRALVNSSSFKHVATEDILKKYVMMDVELAQNIASNLSYFEQADTTKLATFIALHPDPAVVSSLAGNSDAPKKILRKLLHHSDQYVVSRAQETL